MVFKDREVLEQLKVLNRKLDLLIAKEKARKIREANKKGGNE